MTKQVFVDFELPEAMLADTNKIIERMFPNWLLKERSNRIAAFRLLWAGWLFLKYEDGINAKYGEFPGVEYQPYTAMDRPVTFQSVMLQSQYADAMQRMARLYPEVFEDKTKDNNYFLAVLGYAAFREMFDGRLELDSIDAVKRLEDESPEEFAKKNEKFTKLLAEDPETQVTYTWLKDSKSQPFNIKNMSKENK